MKGGSLPGVVCRMSGGRWLSIEFQRHSNHRGSAPHAERFKKPLPD